MTYILGYLLIGVAWGVYHEWKFRAVARCVSAASDGEMHEATGLSASEIKTFKDIAIQRELEPWRWPAERAQDVLLWPVELGAFLWFKLRR